MRLRHAVFAAVLLGALGCGRIREIKGCRALAALVNPVLDDIDERTKKDKGSAPYRHAAAKYKKLAADLKNFELGIPRAERTVDDLGTALNEASVLSTKLADAMERRDNVVAASTRRELAQLARLQKAIAVRLDGECGGH